MKKISSKTCPNRNEKNFFSFISRRIIISLLLALFLWSGVGELFTTKNFEPLRLSTKIALAQDGTPDFSQSGIVMPPPTWGDTGATTFDSSGALDGVNSDGLTPDPGTIPVTTVTQPQVTNIIPTTATEPPPAPPEATAPGNDLGWDVMLKRIFGDHFKDLAGGVLNASVFAAWYGILFLLSVILSFAVFVSALLFDQIMVISIIKFADIVNASGMMAGWVIIRNFINIAFIFILLYLAITTIIGSLGVKQKTTIASVVISALFINFSLFFTKILIDAGNYLAVALYGGGGLEKVSEKIMGGLKLQSLLQLKNITLSGQAGTILLSIFHNVLLGVLVWAFLTATFLFLGRIIMLILLMATSPIGFVGGSIPALSSKSKEWWSALTGQIMVAPIFIFFMVLIKALVSNQAKIQKVFNGVLGGVGGTGFNLGPLIQYTLIIGMLVTGVRITKKMSGVVAGFAETMVKALIGAIMVAVTGGATLAIAGKAGLGSALKVAKDVVTGDIAKKEGFTGMAGRFARTKFMDTVKGASYGHVDLKKVEDTFKKGKKEEIDRLMKKADAVGPQPARDEEKRLKNTLANIDSQINKTDQGRVEEANDKVNELKDDIREAENRIKQAEKTMRNPDSSPEELTRAETQKRQAEEEKERRTRELTIAENTAEEILDSARKPIAESMGTSLEKIEKGIKDSGEEIKKGMERRNAFIAQTEKGGMGFTINGKEVAANMRAQQGEYKGEKDLRKTMLKIAKEEGIDLGATETKSEPSAPKTTPPAGGTPPTPLGP